MTIWLFFSGYTSLQSFLFTLSFWKKRKQIKGISFLIGMLLVTSYICLQSVIIDLEYVEVFHVLYFIGYSPIFLIAPLYFLFLSRYYKSIITPFTVVLHSLPFLIVWTAQFLSFLMIYKKYLPLLFSIQLIIYSIYSVRLINLHSSKKELSVVFNYLNYSIVLLSISIITFYITRVFFNFYSIDFTSIIIIFFMLFSSILGFMIIDQSKLLFTFTPTKIKKYTSSNLQFHNTSSLENNLFHLFTVEKVYLDPNLNAEILSKKLNISRHQLSELINQKLGCSFNELINKYRVESIQKALLSKAKNHLSISGLAQEAGFKSQASFYRIFKNSTGQTPSEFIKNNS